MGLPKLTSGMTNHFERFDKGEVDQIGAIEGNPHEGRLLCQLWELFLDVIVHSCFVVHMRDRSLAIRDCRGFRKSAQYKMVDRRCMSSGGSNINDLLALILARAFCSERADTLPEIGDGIDGVNALYVQNES